MFTSKKTKKEKELKLKETQAEKEITEILTEEIEKAAAGDELEDELEEELEKIELVDEEVVVEKPLSEKEIAIMELKHNIERLPKGMRRRSKLEAKLKRLES